MARTAAISPSANFEYVKNKGGQIAATATRDPRTGNRIVRALAGGRQK